MASGTSRSWPVKWFKAVPLNCSKLVSRTVRGWLVEHLEEVMAEVARIHRDAVKHLDEDGAAVKPAQPLP